MLLTFSVMTCFVQGQADEISVFSLDSKDVGKAVILMFKPDRIILELTYSRDKQAELSGLTSKDLPRKIKISVNGKVLSERTFTEISTGHSMKFDMASPEEAFDTVRVLWKQDTKVEGVAP
jgi:hypothetical protein